MQTEINNKIWEDKDIRSARMSSVKASVNLLDIAERMGLLKNTHSLEDLFTEFNGMRNKIFDIIYDGMELHAQETHTEIKTYDSNAPKQTKTIMWRDDPITEKQIEIIEKIIDREGIEEIPEDWRESLTKGEASDFIGKHPYKK